jgi:2'-5' RNA ligase
LGIAENPALIRLGQEILDEMDQLGFKKDRQNFVPHLTLGRIKYTDNKERFFDLVEKHKEDEIATILVREFQLFESRLSSSGPAYTKLGSFELKYEKAIK